MADTEYVIPERTTVDGVPVFFLRLPGLSRAELIFRVGHADEALPRRGITHLVEHLAMRSRSRRPDWWRANGHVDPLVTRFSVRGASDDISKFVSEVTRNLVDLPLDMLSAELAILRTEAGNSPGGSIKGLWSHRYGARGLGVTDYREFGLRWLGPSEVSAWAEERFTAGNAVLWVSGDLPSNLRLHLRPGARFPPPRPGPIERATPAVYQQGHAGVALSMITKAEITTRYIVSEVLDDRVRQRIRHDQSLAYDARVDLQTGGITAYADALAENSEQAAASLVAIVRELAEHGHRPEELERALASNHAARQEPGAALESLTDAASLELGVATSTISWDDYDREAAALTAADIAVATQQALSTALLAIPEGVSCDIDGFTPIPEDNGIVFDGEPLLAAADAGHDMAVLYSDQGISIGTAGATKHGIYWHDIAAALWWSDGTRVLIALDGSARQFVPTNWKRSEGLFEAIRIHVPADRWVPMDGPPRSVATEAAEIEADSEKRPEPSRSESQARPTRRLAPRWVITFGMIAAWMLLVVLAWRRFYG